MIATCSELRALTIVLAVSSAACGDGTGKPDGAAMDSTKAAKTAAPRPQTKLHATRDQKDVSMVSALAYRDGDGNGHVLVSSVPLDCSAFSGTGRELADGEVNFEVTLGRRLLPGGTLQPIVSGMYFDGMNYGGRTHPTTLGGEIAPGAPFTVDVDFSISSIGKSPATLVAKGTIEAIGCEAPRPYMGDRPPLPEPMPATIEIAGLKLPVRSAGLTQHELGVTLILSSGGDACFGSPERAVPGELTAEILYRPGKDVPFQVTIGGTLPGQAFDQTFDEKRVTVTPRPTLSPDAAMTEYELEVELTVIEHPVKLEGKVKAGACPAR